jgi:hypothetical protein
MTEGLLLDESREVVREPDGSRSKFDDLESQEPVGLAFGFLYQARHDPPSSLLETGFTPGEARVAAV